MHLRPIQADAAIAAGRRNGVTEIKQGVHGVAFEAKVRFVSGLVERFELVLPNSGDFEVFPDLPLVGIPQPWRI